MKRKKKISVYVFNILAWSFIALISLSTYAVAVDISSLFNPPLTKEEEALYQKTGKDKKEIDKFINTRLFMRKASLFAAELPEGVSYQPDTHGCPLPPSENSDFKYSDDYLAQYDFTNLTNGNEQLLLFTIKTGCSGKNGISHPIGVNCGEHVNRDAILSQLTPPVSQQEVLLFEKANQCPASEMPKFLAMRKYIREINKLMAELPAGQKLDPLKAPPVPAKCTEYTIGNETNMVFQIFQAQLSKSLSDVVK
ncbi:MAG: hypothetical protein ABSC11_01780 [Smithella sp.]|jgi:hypothetical protein